jgi:hypothetical protein
MRDDGRFWRAIPASQNSIFAPHGMSVLYPEPTFGSGTKRQNLLRRARNPNLVLCF